ncbi:hypothetical protein NKR23_g2475 [Pleurostoma richardsiae]|uniref:Uncharacterized protein n=1 Tax=Pleurostoma richardsiae TaxID=41990 RepID=A0AA38VVB6_9PEZI|nr:hypothetical protein NKR23_g2475 [Pleurostoma richardsiae]
MEVSTETGHIDPIDQIDDFDYDLGDDERDDHNDEFDIDIDGGDHVSATVADSDVVPAVKADVRHDTGEAANDAAVGLNSTIPDVLDDTFPTQSHGDDGREGHDLDDEQIGNEIDYDDEDDYHSESHGDDQLGADTASGEVLNIEESYPGEPEHGPNIGEAEEQSNPIDEPEVQNSYAREVGVSEADASHLEDQAYASDAEHAAEWELGEHDADNAEDGSTNDAGVDHVLDDGVHAVSPSQAHAGHDSAQEDEDAGATATSWMGDGETQETHALSRSLIEPDVKVIYRDEEFSLLAGSSDDDPNSYFLADSAALDAPLAKFLSDVRHIISAEVTQSDEIVMRVDGLGLEFGETTTADFLERATFRQLIELHDKLVKADDPTASHTLYVFLVTRPSCLQRFAELINGVNEGKGLTELGSFFDNALPFELSPGESGDEIVSQDVSAEDQQYDDMEIQGEYEALEMVNATEQQHEVEAPSVIPLQTREVSAAAGEIELFGDGDDDHANRGVAANGSDEPSIETVPQDAIGETVEVAGQTDHHMIEEAEDATYHADDDQRGEVTTGVEDELLDYDTNEEFDDSPGQPSQLADDHDQQGLQEPTTTNIDHAMGNNDNQLHDESSDIHANDEVYLEHHEYAETNEVEPNLAEETQIPVDLATHSSPPQGASENTSATATVNGDEIDFDDDDVPTQGDAGNTRSADHVSTRDKDHPETSVNEIDWENEDDGILDQSETNLSPSSISVKRSRQADEGDGSGDENALKRRRT